MIPLATTFRSKGFEFTQIVREGKHAIYRKKRVGHDFEVYEVVVIIEEPEHTWPNGDTTPDHERMPSGEMWGVKGWTCLTKERAWEKLRENVFLSNLTRKDAFE